MNEPRPVPPQGSIPQGPPHPAAQPHASQPHASQHPPQGHAHPPAHAPRPAGSAPRAPVAPIAPPPAQRLPGQPAHLGGPAVQPPRHAPPPPLPAANPRPSPDGEEDLINLEDDDDAAPPAAAVAVARAVAPAPAPQAPVGQIAPASKIRITGAGDKHNYTHFKRPTHVGGAGACRVRTFHGRLSDEGLAFLDDKINEWLDNHPDVEVKFVNSLIGTMGGKTGESEMFVTIWY